MLFDCNTIWGDMSDRMESYMEQRRHLAVAEDPFQSNADYLPPAATVRSRSSLARR